MKIRSWRYKSSPCGFRLPIIRKKSTQGQTEDKVKEGAQLERWQDMTWWTKRDIRRRRKLFSMHVKIHRRYIWWRRSRIRSWRRWMRNRSSIIWERRSCWGNRFLSIRIPWMSRGTWFPSCRGSWQAASRPRTTKTRKWLIQLNQWDGIMKVRTKMAAFHTCPTKLQTTNYTTSNANNSSSNYQSSMDHTAKINLSNTAIRPHLISSNSRNTRRIFHTKLTLHRWHNLISIRMMPASHSLIYSWTHSSIYSKTSSRWQSSHETSNLWPSLSKWICRNQCRHQDILQEIPKETSHPFRKRRMFLTRLVSSQ